MPLRLALLYLVLFPGVLWHERLPAVGIGALGLLVPGLARLPALWLAAAVASGAPLVAHWPRSDNHTYLLFYWCLALALALALTDPAGALTRSARGLLGLVFAFATLWKVWLSPDFASGDFFRSALLLDPRFLDLARLGGLTPDALAANDALLDAVRGGAPLPAGERLVEPARLRVLAIGLTAWTLAGEAAVALAFLWPGERGPARWRHPLLLLFCVTTFSVATVPGFGCLLAAIGAAASTGRLRGLYAGAFLLVWAYAVVPVGSALLGGG
jgi:hypothetical protein